MPLRKDKGLSIGDVFSNFADNLKLAATRPNIHGYVPHPKQIKFHSANTKGRLYIGGNRSGKTTGGVIEDIWWLKREHPFLLRDMPDRPIRGRVVAPDFVNGIQKIILPEFARWLPPSYLKNGSWTDSYSVRDRTLTLENGSFVEFMSYEQELDSFAGTSRDFLHCDEEPPKAVFEENTARLIDTAGYWWMTMTPVEGMSWVYDLIYLLGKNDPNSNITVIEVDMLENPHLSRQEAESYLAGLSPDDRLARGRGQFVQVGGLVFKDFDIEKHVIDPMIPPKDWEWYLSMDHGLANPSAFLWHAVSPQNQIITFAEHYEAEKTIEYHANKVHAMNATFGKSPDTYVADPAIRQINQAVTGTSVQMEYANLGLPFILGNNDVSVGVARMTQYLTERSGGVPFWTITRNCPNLIREMQRLRWKKWASKKMAYDNNRHETIHKKDDHAPDSARYFISVRPDLTPLDIELGKQAKYPLGTATPAQVGVTYDMNWRGENTQWSIDETLGEEW
jgi:phage terminase large subunit-like protein